MRQAHVEGLQSLVFERGDGGVRHLKKVGRVHPVGRHELVPLESLSTRTRNVDLAAYILRISSMERLTCSPLKPEANPSTVIPNQSPKIDLRSGDASSSKLSVFQSTCQ